jgi:hypothetical protein
MTIYRKAKLTSPIPSRRLGRVSSTGEALKPQICALIGRYSRQNGVTEIPSDQTATFAQRLVDLIAIRGLPRPLAPGEMGQPGEISGDVIRTMLVGLLEGLLRADDLEPIAKQIVKTCFYPPFTDCRESYRELDRSGACRRQLLDRARSRVSGSHCVDCPYWTSLSAAEHEDCLREAWVGDSESLTRHRDIFLPQDFREFRALLRQLAAEMA